MSSELQREQIDLLLESLEAIVQRRRHEKPGDPALQRDIIDHTRALLRRVDLEHHLHICDYAQQLLLTVTVDMDAAPPSAPESTPGAFMHAVTARDPVTDLGIPLADDPFDQDSYAPEGGQGDRASNDDSAVQQAAIARERRCRKIAAGKAALRRGLTAKQLATLDTMAQFGWTLEFVRRPLFNPPVPVAFDRNRDQFVVVFEDGSAAEDPGVRVRA